MSSEYEQAKQELVQTVIAFLEAGEAAGKTQAELTGEFMLAFQTAVVGAQEPV